MNSPVAGSNEEEDAYQPKQRRDTFHLRRGTVTSDNDDGGYGGYNKNTSPMGGSNNMQNSRDRDRHYSNSSDGDGGGYGMRNDRIWSEETSGGGADFKYGQGGSENARRVSTAASPLKKSLLAADDQIFMTHT